MTNLLDLTLKRLARLDVPGVRRAINFLRPRHKIPRDQYFLSIFDGLSYRGSLAEYIDREIFYFGAYCPAELDFLAQAASRLKAKVFYDIGANVGQHSLWMSSRVQQVFAFEPSRSATEQFIANLVRNGKTNVQTFLCALGSENGSAILGGGFSGNSGSRSLLWGGGDETVTVACGDEFVQSHRLPPADLVKIDVEGFEREVFRGLQNTLQRDRPVILFEMLNAPNNPFSDPDDLRKHLYENHCLFSLTGRRRAKLCPFNWQVEEVVCIPSEKLQHFHGMVPAIS